VDANSSRNADCQAHLATGLDMLVALIQGRLVRLTRAIPRCQVGAGKDRGELGD